MTALKDYARLETSGLWRADADAQRRNVGVSFGDATLVITDQSGRPLAHWSLAAIERLNAGKRPALFSPDGSDIETLELEDDDMIAAIETVRKTIARARPRPGRLRGAILAGTAIALGYIGLVWLPEAAIKHTVSVLPAVQRIQIGNDLMAEITRVSGQPCVDAFGTVSLRRLKAALTPGRPGNYYVLPQGLATSAALPGGHILIGRSLIEDFDDPNVVAGYIAAEVAAQTAVDPIEAILRQSGPLASFRLLTSGRLSDTALQGYAQHLLTGTTATPPTDTLLETFRQMQVPTRPYALALDVTGESTLELIEGDPFHGVNPVQLLNDNDWISLQSICDVS